MPAVSIITPTYNRPALLRQAIESVLAQSFSDFEHIIVDNGSASETRAVVEGFGDSRIRYVYQENGGRSAARNRGLALATGEYVAFLDDDDLYLPDKLAVQVAFLEDQPAVGLVAGGAQLIDAGGFVVREWRAWLERLALTLPACLYACPLLTCAVLLRRHWMELLDNWFDAEMDRAEDTDFWIRLLAADCRMEWVPEIVCAYRRHAGDSQGDSEGYYRSYLRMLDKLYARADLPAEVVAERPALYAHYHLLGACYAYAAGDLHAGRQRLRLAAEADPGLMLGTPPAFAEKLAGIAQAVTNEGAAVQIGAIFDALPPELAQLRPWRRHALSALHMQQVFTAHAAGNRPRLNDWMQGVYWNPHWLRNRGVWTILLRDVIMGGAASGPGG